MTVAIASRGRDHLRMALGQRFLSTVLLGTALLVPGSGSAVCDDDGVTDVLILYGSDWARPEEGIREIRSGFELLGADVVESDDPPGDFSGFDVVVNYSGSWMQWETRCRRAAGRLEPRELG